MRKIILDCDPGHDDAMAILLAARRLDVLGITTVAGNQSIDKVTTNALKVAEFAGLTHIPIARGAGRPLVRAPLYAAEVHGETGLDGPVLPPPSISTVTQPGVEFLIGTLLAHDQVTLVPIGPLTNVATALLVAPHLVDHVREICLMGGSSTRGNVTAAAEFNVYVDPEAAHIVFTSGIPIKMVGLNVTEQVTATPDRRQQIRALGTRVAAIVVEMLEFYSSTLQTLHGLPGGAMHDPLAVAALIDPAIVQFEPMHVAVELRGEHTLGMTVCDRRQVRRNGSGALHSGAPPNAEVAVGVDSDRFFRLFMAALAEYDT